MKPFQSIKPAVPVHGAQPPHHEQAVVPFKPFKPFKENQLGTINIQTRLGGLADGVQEVLITFAPGVGHFDGVDGVQWGTNFLPDGAGVGPFNQEFIYTVAAGSELTITGHLVGMHRDGPEASVTVST